MQKLSRRRFLQNSAVMMAAASHPLFASAAATSAQHLLLVGTGTSWSSRGIYSFIFDSSAGELQAIGLAAAAQNPTFLLISPDGARVYSVNENESFQGVNNCGSISSYSLNRASGMLTKINEVPSLGGTPAHVAVDHTGQCVFAANYNGGSAVSFHVGTGGALSSAVSFEQYHGHGPNPSRQSSPHAHRVTLSPDNKFLLVNDLGLDMIHIYQLDAATAKLTLNSTPAWNASPGSGPRALRFHPNGKWAYCVNEILSTVDVLDWNSSLGQLTTVQQLFVPPAGYSGQSKSAEIVLDSQGRFAYVANRLDNFIATYAVSSTTGKLTLQRRSSCGGTVPRHIALDPTEHWLLVANQGSNTVAWFQRNTTTGVLASTGKTFPISSPECVVFA